MVKVNAGNDRNGNPRRGWLLLGAGGRSAFFDEGYQGSGAIPKQYRHLAVDAPELEITPRQYRALVKFTKKTPR